MHTLQSEYRPVARFGRNTLGRDLITGDIHGMFGRLQVHLDELGFDESRDRLFAVGDLVDRGPDSEAALEWLAKPWFHSVLGNHEEMCLRWGLFRVEPFEYRAHGGGWALDMPHERLMDYVEAFDKLPILIELETAGGTVGLVHAEIPTSTWQETVELLEGGYDVQVNNEVRYSCLWDRSRFDTAIASNKAWVIGGIANVVSGHSPVRTPSRMANVLLIDTGACFGGPITLIDAATLAPAERETNHGRTLQPAGAPQVAGEASGRAGGPAEVDQPDAGCRLA